MTGIKGSTDVYFILGDPVAQVLAPEVFNPLFARFGIDAVIVPVQLAGIHRHLCAGSRQQQPCGL